MASSGPRVAVVGGGLAGLSATIALAEAGMPVDLFSLVPVKRSHSVCAQGGINAAVNTKGEGDSPALHFYDTIKGGDFLANQPPVNDMCREAPAIIHLMDRMGVTFNRTDEGLLDFRRFGGTLHNRTAYAGATTGQQLLYALDEQARRWEVEGRVTKYEFWDYLEAVLDDAGAVRGLVAVNIHSLEVRAFPAEAVILATGGPGLVFGRTTNSMINTGAAAASAYRQGAKYANGEFMQIHPTAIPGDDKLRLMSESARGEGGRVWVPGDPKKTYRNKVTGRNAPCVSKTVPLTGDAAAQWEAAPPDPDGRWYFLEDNYPRYLNLVPRDVGARELHAVVYRLGLGVNGKPEVYLDLRPEVVNAGPLMRGKTPLTHESLDFKLKGILDIYHKFVGDDPHRVPMRIFPAVHYSMGGLWVDYEATPDGYLRKGHPKNHMTNIPGLYAVGEVDYQYHGANRLGANSLLSCIYGGLITGPSAAAYVRGRAASAPPEGFFAAEARRRRDALTALQKNDGAENPYLLHAELGDVMMRDVTIVRENATLKGTLEQIAALKARYRRVKVPDQAARTNQGLLFARALGGMFDLAELMTKGALARDECRGSHHKDECLIDQPVDFQIADYKEYHKMRQEGAADAALRERFKPGHLAYMRAFEAQNERWLKTTIAAWNPRREGCDLSYEDVDLRVMAPLPRKYD